MTVPDPGRSTKTHSFVITLQVATRVVRPGMRVAPSDGVEANDHVGGRNSNELIVDDLERTSARSSMTPRPQARTVSASGAVR